MPSASSSRWQTAFSVLLSLVIATGLWYLVVGRDHVETQVELRVEYRGLPSNLVIGDGMVNQLSVRLRGSAELLRNLHSRDLVYTVDLSSLKRGANALPLHVGDLPDLKPFEIMEVMPSRLVLEADALTERVIPLVGRLVPLSSDSPYVMSQVMLEPSFVTVKGPEMQVSAIERLPVLYDPTKNASEGPHETNVAITAPPQLEITPAVTTLRYTLELKTESVSMDKPIQIDSDAGDFSITPERAHIEISVPENLVHERDYLDAVRIVVRPPTGLDPGAEADVPLLVMLPSGARLSTMKPASVRIVRHTSKGNPVSQWTPADSPFSMPVNMFGMGLSERRVTRDFSLDDLALPTSAMPQPDDLKVHPVIPSEAGKDRQASSRPAAGVSAVTGPAAPPAPAVQDIAQQPLPSPKNNSKGRN